MSVSPSFPSAGSPAFSRLRPGGSSVQSPLHSLKIALANVREIAAGHGIWNNPREAWGLSVGTEESCGTARLKLAGELDIASARLAEECIAVAQEAHRSVIVDLEDLSFMDSNGVDIMRRARLRSQATDGQLQVVNAHKHRRLFLMCHAGFLIDESPPPER